jgi:iron(III) transport system substrate-binding protein
MVVLYCAQDQDFAEPILRDFEKETGVKVRTVYDSEAVKTVGLANRLLAERAHPQADVFWGNEEFRTRQLAAAGVFATNDWTPLTGFHRMRMLVVNTNLVKLGAAPQSLTELTNAAWRGKVALAYPLFGTTATHFLALRQAWGETRWLDWCRALQANKPFVVDGNSVVVNLVGRGEASIGLTDSDDIAAGQREGLPIAGASLGTDTLRIPNTVAIVHGASHRASAEKLVTFLNRPPVKQRLAEANAFSADRPEEPAGLSVNWEALLDGQDKAVADLKAIFLR